MFTTLAKDLPLNCPCSSFLPSDLPNLPSALRDNLLAEGCESPTALEGFAVPLGLSGRDLVVIGADRGAGFASSLVVSVLGAMVRDVIDRASQPTASRPPTGARVICQPRALVLAPTRPLLADLARATRALTKGLGIKFAVACGGSPVEEIIKDLSDINLLLATPRRVTDLIERGHLSVAGVRIVGLAEADTLIDLGFDGSLGSLLQGLPSVQDRQQMLMSCTTMSAGLSILLPSLTKPNAVHLAARDPWRAVCFNELLTQHVCYAEDRSKQAAVAELVRAVPGLVLIVAGTRRTCEVLGYFLRSEQIAAAEVHAEKLRSRERDQTLQAFSTGRTPVLVTTDGALRTFGSELPPVQHVISFDFPDSMQVRWHDLPVRCRALADPASLSHACRSTPIDCNM